jgi:hypothetical protein
MSEITARLATPTDFAEIVSDDFPVLARNNAGDNVYHCRECVSLGKLIYLAVACT